MKKTLLTILLMLPWLALAQTPEGFEGTWTVPTGGLGAGGPTGWAIANVGGPQQKWELGTAGSYAGAHHAVIAAENVAAGTTGEDWLITPAITVPANGELRFYSRLMLAQNQLTSYKIKICTTTGSTALQTTLANYIGVITWTEDELNPSALDWTQKAVSLSAYAGQVVYIAFVMQGDNGDGWMIDNVDVTATCTQPTNIVVTNVTLTSATVSWVSSPDVTSWEIEVVPATAVPSGVGIAATSNPFTLTGLVPGTYKVYVRSICSGGGNSPWPAPCIFTVPVCPVTDQCNYTFNLTDSWGDGWNGNSMNVIQNGTIVAVLTFNAGASATVTVPLCDAMPFQLYWNPGGATPQEVGIQVLNSNSQTVYSKPAGTGAQNTLLFEGQAQCMQDACYPPYNVTVSTLGTTATVGWAEAATGEWQYYLVASPAQEPDAGTVATGTTTTNPFTISDIEPGADYTVYIRSVCPGMLGGTINSAWSQPAYFSIGSGNYLTGNVSVDINGDEICNTNDIVVPGIELIATIGTNAPFSVYADAQGHYVIDDIAAAVNVQVSISPVAPAGFEDTTPAINTFTFPVAVAPEVNLCLPAPSAAVNDIEVIMVPLSTAQAGFYAHYAIFVQNNSILQANNVTVTLDYNNNSVEVYAIDDSFVQADANTVTITVGNIAPLQTATTDVWFYILPPPANVGGEALAFTSYAAMDATDAVMENNYYTLNQTIVNSLDPNDITVHEGGMIPIEDVVKYLHYTIRFQNTGTAPAVNIRVENELDANLDWATFDPIAASHDFTATRTGGNMLTFKFDNIFLADSTTNEAASHGYITYRIKPKADIADGDVVNSTADIFFDFNDPITTNTASSTFYDVLSAGNYGTGKVVLYPNPVKDVLYINALQSALQSVAIYDINGRLCITSGNLNMIDTHGLSPGMYLVKATTDRGTSSYKLIKH